MKKIFFALLLATCASFATAQSPSSVTMRDAVNAFPQSQERCGNTALHKLMQMTDAGYLQRRQEINEFTEQWIKEKGNRKTAAVVTIPVVVHVVYANANQNITDAQIQSQMDVLTADFRRQNADTANTPTDFASVVGDSEIEFCLASIDPSGMPTTGITRTQTSTSEIGNAGIHYTAQGGKDGWDPDSYLNLWVCEISAGGGLLGYATPPGFATVPAEDGAVIDYRYFGTMGTVVAPFNLGRTATHEVGHYFNLEHIWGVNGGCSDDDLVADTPIQSQDNFGCPSHPSASCNTDDMFMNYMDYVDDNCMNSFTIGQRDRMHAAINGPRVSLLSSNGCSGVVAVDDNLGEEFTLSLYPNPSAGLVRAAVQVGTAQDVELSVYSLLGERLSSKTVEQVRSSEVELDLSTLPQGMYLVEMRAGDARLVKRLIKQ